MPRSNDTFLNPAPAGRLWLGAEDEPVGVRLFRRVFTLPAAAAPAAAAMLRIFADMRFHLWLNGKYLGRGPTFFHPHRRPLHSYELADRLRPGRNVLAVLVQSSCLSFHNYVAAGLPGLIAELNISFSDAQPPLRIASDDGGWRASARSGWLPDTPRRTWATPPVEAFSAALAQDGWQQLNFDDSAWDTPSVFPARNRIVVPQYFDSELPNLKFYWRPVRKILGFCRATGTAPILSAAMASGDYGRHLMTEPWVTPVEKARILDTAPDAQGGFTITDLDGTESVAVALDLGRQYTGSVCFTLDAESAGMIDIGWAESLNPAARPELLRKDNTYADRFIAEPGRNRWQPLNFSAGRYVSFVLRGFRGTLRFRRAGMLSAQPDLDWNARFSSDDPLLNDIWQLCVHSVACGTQEGLMDCPTREQAAYVGDGNPTAAWIGRLTGDYSHWRALIRETFAVQTADGQIKSVVFTGQQHILLDYTLLAVIGARNYLQTTEDLELVREILPAAGKLLGWYLRRLNADGLFDLPWESLDRGAPWVKFPATAADSLRDCGFNIFIDHPGMGWHNRNEPGIDRRGLNAAINALLRLTLQAFQELRQACGLLDEPELEIVAGRLTAKAGELFWNPATGVFADGMLDGNRLAQVSQQTNIWCLEAGLPGPASGASVLHRLLDLNDRDMARSGPYFWYYMYEEFARAGMLAEALAETKRLWGGMLQAGATTVWETFSGDELDSLCHPWSAAPADFLLRHIAGIGVFTERNSMVELRPRPDLLDKVQARLPSPRGPVTVSWRRRNGRVFMRGSLPAGMRAVLFWPDGRSRSLEGNWSASRKLGAC